MNHAKILESPPEEIERELETLRKELDSGIPKKSARCAFSLDKGVK